MILHPCVTGGMIVFSSAENFYDECSEYSENLVPTISQLEAEGQWRHLDTRHVDDYYKSTSGIFFYFKITK